MLSCLNEPTKSAVSTLHEIASGKLRMEVGSTDTMKLAVNHLKVLATANILKASHHNHGSEYITFSGQDGVSFMKNLIADLKNKREAVQNIALTFDSGIKYWKILKSTLFIP